MDIGLSTILTEYSIDITVLALRAEELGFESLWAAEHTIIPLTATTRRPGVSLDTGIPEDYAHIVDPFVALARASAVTTTLKLGTGVCLLPERNPLLVAKQVATLDVYSGGRVLFGVGAGWLKEETEIMGGDFEHRWTQTREAVLAMKELWAAEEGEFHGRYYDFPAVYSFPKPVQRPHPPVLLAGASANVFKRVIAWGDGWVPDIITPEQVKDGRATPEQARQGNRARPHSDSSYGLWPAARCRSDPEIRGRGGRLGEYPAAAGLRGGVIGPDRRDSRVSDRASLGSPVECPWRYPRSILLRSARPATSCAVLGIKMGPLITKGG